MRGTGNFCEKTVGSEGKLSETSSGVGEYIREGSMWSVWRSSCLAGSLTQIMTTVKELEEWSINQHVLTQKIDTMTLEGRLFFRITSDISE